MALSDRIIRHPGELSGLSVLPLMRPRPAGIVRVESDALDAASRSNWERRLNRAYRACGCGEASLGTVTGLLMGAVWSGTRWTLGSGTVFGTVEILLGCIVIGTILGKAVGLLRAQAKLNDLIKEIRAEWKGEPIAHREDPCG
jgi:hypothetical protein